MALTANQKLEVRKAIHRSYSQRVEPLPWTKADVDAAITAADGWNDGNKASFNAALSDPYKTASSSADKAILLLTVVAADYIAGNPTKAAILKDIISRLETA